jgi:hypothetical protein
MKKCFLCGKPLKGNAHIADTRDDQKVWVGPDCSKKIAASGNVGLLTKAGIRGVRLYAIEATA